MAATRKSLVRLCHKAADLIEARGLAKGTLWDEKGRLCMAGALLAAMKVKPIKNGTMSASFREIERNRAALLCCGFETPYLAITWNNRKRRTAAEVVARLRSAK